MIRTIAPCQPHIPLSVKEVSRMTNLNKYVIIARLHILIKQEGFSEADLKEAVDLLHKELFPEVWAKTSALNNKA